MAKVYASRGWGMAGIEEVGQLTFGVLSDANDKDPRVVRIGASHYFGAVELYNRDYLLREIDAGAHSDTWSDLVVAARFVHRFGISAARSLNGDYVLGEYNDCSHELTLCRDHFGVRALCYQVTSGGLRFAPLVSPILNVASRPRVLPERLAQFLMTGEVSGDGTCFDGLKYLLPGHFLKGSGDRGWISRQYYFPQAHVNKRRLNGSEATVAIEASLNRAIRKRLPSRHPPVVSLSGGLDSSTIAGWACKLTGGPVMAVSTVLPGDCKSASVDERRFIESLAGKWPNLMLQFVTGVGEDPLHWPDDPASGAEPEGNQFAFMHRALFNAAKSMGASTLLAGYSGDDFISSNADAFLTEAFLKGNPRLFQQEFSRLRHEGETIKSIVLRRIVKPLLPQGLIISLGRAPMDEPPANTSLRRRAYNDLGVRQYRVQMRRLMLPSKTVLSEHLVTADFYLSSRMHEAETLLLRTGLAVKDPLLDRELVELVLSTAFNLKKNATHARMLIRSAGMAVLPDEILWRKDKGHANPRFSRFVAERLETIEKGLKRFASIPMWTSLVSEEKVKEGIGLLALECTTSDQDVAIANQVLRPYQLGLFLERYQ